MADQSVTVGNGFRHKFIKIGGCNNFLRTFDRLMKDTESILQYLGHKKFRKYKRGQNSPEF